MAQKKRKDEKSSNVIESLPNTPTFRDIVPNRVNENQLNRWIEHDNSSYIIASILDDIIGKLNFTSNTVTNVIEYYK